MAPKKTSLWVKKYAIIRNKMLRKYRNKLNKYTSYEAHYKEGYSCFYTTRILNPDGIRWY